MYFGISAMDAESDDLQSLFLAYGIKAFKNMIFERNIFPFKKKDLEIRQICVLQHLTPNKNFD